MKYVIVITAAFCCKDCAVREATWVPKSVEGPFSLEEAVCFLRENGFGAKTSPLGDEPEGKPGILWYKRSGVWRTGVICPL